MADPKERFCPCCGLKLTRKRFNGRLEDRTAFARRVYCSRICANTRTPEAKEKRRNAILDQQKKTAGHEPELEKLNPLEFMLREMNNTSNEMELRAKMAIAAAKYCHPLATVSTGKKDLQQERAKAAAGGRFAPLPPPKVVPINSISKS